MTRTLLLVDRNPTIKRLVELSFAGEGVEVVSAADADEAIGALSRSTPDVVLADVGLAGSGGYDLAAHIRRTPSLARIPIVLLAGPFDDIDRGRATAAGADDVLAKPIDPPALVTRVRELWLAAGQPEGPPVVAVETTIEPPPVVVAPPPPAAPEVDRYFEQLDRAFADLVQNPRPAIPSDGIPMDDPTQPSTPPTPLHVPSPTAAAPGLTEAFAALLHAEQSGTEPSFVTPAADPPASPLDVDHLADLVVARVLERLTDSVVRAVVADLVSETAERLVREEIERIKRNIT